MQTNLITMQVLMLPELLSITIFLALLTFLALSRQPRYRPSFITIPRQPVMKQSRRHLKAWLQRNSPGFRDKNSDDLDLFLLHEGDQFIS